MNFSGFIDACKRLGIRIPFSVNSYESEYPKTDESDNIDESGKISSSVNLVLVGDLYRDLYRSISISSKPTQK